MKKGDVVTIWDSSYSKVVTNHGLVSGYSGLHSVRGKRGIIVELNCEFPNQHEYQARIHSFNDTVVRTDCGKTVFIEERFLKLVSPKHKIMIDMEQIGCVTPRAIIEISDKLYKEIKRGP